MPRSYEMEITTTMPPLDELGPKMRALKKDQWRQFVWAYMLTGGRGSDAALAAGYTKGNATYTANRLLQNPDIEEAIRECNWRALNNSVVEAVLALREVVADPTHKDRIKAADMILARTGFIAQTGQQQTVTHQLDQKQVNEMITKLAGELGLDPAKLLGQSASPKKIPKSLPIIDLEPLPELDPELAELF
jgi:phage terminase small subunit